MADRDRPLKKICPRMQRPSKIRPREKGFSLMEMVMVVVVVGLALGLVLPSLDVALFQGNLRSESRRLIALLNQGRGQAVLDRQPWTLDLIIERDDESFDDYEKEDKCLVFRPHKGVRIEDVYFSESGLSATKGIVSLVFRPAGTTDPVLVHLVDSSGDKKTVIVKLFNPRPSISDGYADPDKESEDSGETP